MSHESPDLLPMVGIAHDDPVLDAARRMPLDEFSAKAHFGFGMGLRNAMRLWEPDSPSHLWFVRHGVHHPDDMGALMLVAIWHAARGREPLPDVWDAQIERFRVHWWKWDRQGLGQKYGPPRGHRGLTRGDA